MEGKASYAGDPVGQKQLVMHAMVEAPEVLEQLELLPGPRAVQGRVEDTNLQVRVQVQPRIQVLVVLQFEAVDQEPHAHTTVSRQEQSIEQQATSAILVPEVRLHIKGRLGSARQGQPQVEPLGPTIDRDDARRSGGVTRLQQTSEVAVMGRRQHPGWLALEWLAPERSYTAPEAEGGEEEGGGKGDPHPRKGGSDVGRASFGRGA